MPRVARCGYLKAGPLPRDGTLRPEAMKKAARARNPVDVGLPDNSETLIVDAPRLPAGIRQPTAGHDCVGIQLPGDSCPALYAGISNGAVLVRVLGCGLHFGERYSDLSKASLYCEQNVAYFRRRYFLIVRAHAIAESADEFVRSQYPEIGQRDVLMKGAAVFIGKRWFEESIGPCFVGLNQTRVQPSKLKNQRPHCLLETPESDRNLEPTLVALIGARHFSLTRALQLSARGHRPPGFVVEKHVANRVVRSGAVLKRKAH